MNIPLDEVLYFDAITSTPSTGAAVDADSTPTFACYEEGTDTDIGVGGNMTKRTSLTGNYRGTFTLSAANGFEVGKWYSIVVSATVGAVAGKAVVKNFRVVAAEATAGVQEVNVKNINNVAAATPGANGGILIAGSNAATTFATLTVSGATTLTGNVSMAAGLTITQSTSNASAFTVTGNGTGHGVVFTSGSGATGDGMRVVAVSTTGNGLHTIGTEAGMFNSGTAFGVLNQGTVGTKNEGLGGDGMENFGSIHGVYNSGDNGYGVYDSGTIAGLYCVGGQYGIYCLAEVNGHGLYALSGTNSGSGIYCKAQGNSDQDSGIYATSFGALGSGAYFEAKQDGHGLWVESEGDGDGIHADVEGSGVDIRGKLAPDAIDNILVESGISASAALTNDSGSQLTSINARQALALFGGALGGVLAGAATTTITIKGAGLPSGNTRVTATVDSSGNRSALTIKVPD